VTDLRTAARALLDATAVFSAYYEASMASRNPKMSDGINVATITNNMDGDTAITVGDLRRLRSVQEAARDALAARAQPTNDEVLWEGETRMIMHTDPRDNGKDSFVNLPPEGFAVPPGTRVRVVRATDQPPGPDGLSRQIDQSWDAAIERAADQPSEDQP
jgi:hypothetical protein